jgi:ferric iron reductase protein FhuF
MLTFPALAGSYQGRVATAGFRRRSCCLIYQLAPPGAADYCGDCVLAPSA